MSKSYRSSKGGGTPMTVSIGPIPEWNHLGVCSLVPNSRLLLVPSQDSDTVSIVDLNELEIISVIQLPKKSVPWHAMATPDGKLAFVTNTRFNGHVDTTPKTKSTVSVIDIRKGELVKNIPVMAGPVMVEMDKRRNRAYVTNRISNTVSVIDLDSLEVTGNVKVGKAPFWIKLTPKNDLLVVGNFEEASLSILDAESLTVKNTIVVGKPASNPYPEFGVGDTVGFSIDKDGFAYVANWRSHKIVKVNLYAPENNMRKALVGSQRVVKFPFDVILDERTGSLVVGSYDAQNSKLVVTDFAASGNAKEKIAGNAVAEIPLRGTQFPAGAASNVNYWVSEPFENRVIGILSRGPKIINPVDLVAAVL